MDESDGLSILKRMTAAGLEAAPADRRVLPVRALSSAVSRAGEAGLSMPIVASSSSERIASLSDLLEMLPESGLLGVLEGPGEGQGLMAFDAALLAAVIEKQMTGALGAKAPAPRRATRTDAALAADLIDATLREFEAALQGREESRWASGFGYSSHLEDIRPLGLLLEDVDYRIFQLDLTLELGARTGRLVLAVPAEGRGKIGQPSATEMPVADERDEAWQRGFEDAVLGAEVRVEAVMHRVRMPFVRMQALRVGDEVALVGSSVDTVRVSSAEGATYGIGRLGQSRGHRAVRLVAPGETTPELRHSEGNGMTSNLSGGADVSFAAPQLASSQTPAREPAPLPPLGGGPDIALDLPTGQAMSEDAFAPAPLPPLPEI